MTLLMTLLMTSLMAFSGCAGCLKRHYSRLARLEANGLLGYNQPLF